MGNGCERLRTVANGCERLRNVWRTQPQPPDNGNPCDAFGKNFPVNDSSPYFCGFSPLKITPISQHLERQRLALQQGADALQAVRAATAWVMDREAKWL